MKVVVTSLFLIALVAQVALGDFCCARCDSTPPTSSTETGCSHCPSHHEEIPEEPSPQEHDCACHEGDPLAIIGEMVKVDPPAYALVPNESYSLGANIPLARPSSIRPPPRKDFHSPVSLQILFQVFRN